MSRFAPQSAAEDELLAEAEFYQFDNQSPGDPGYCRPRDARWTIETLSPEQLKDVFSSQKSAQDWLADEIAMDEADEMHREWARLLVEDIREAPVVLMRDTVAYVWDGWHRLAAAIARNRAIAVIVGRPLAMC